MEGANDIKITDEDRRGVDGRQLTEEIGIDAAEIDWRKSFTQFDDADRERLDGMSDIFDEIADDLCGQFYDHLQSYSEAMAILESSSKPIEALKRSQLEYLRDLGRGSYGRDYFNRRARIGKIHDMLDLGPKIYLGAYSIYYEGILGAIADDLKSELVDTDGGVDVAAGGASPGVDDGSASPGAGDGSVTTAEEALDAMAERSLSVLKLLTIDQQVAMDTYIHSYSQQIEDELERRRRVANEVRSGVTELRDTSRSVAQSSQQISDIADGQAENMGEVATEISDLSATVEEVAATTDQVASRSTETRELAEDGQASATEAIDAMETVESSAAEVADDVDRLQERVEEIDEVVQVINDITEQTNLLALNASIEAARAGEAGEGFAVVADEVKALAQQSRERAEQIETVVDRIQEDTDSTVRSLDETNDAIAEGIEQVERSMENLIEIVDAVEEVTDGVEEVSVVTDEQAASAEEVSSLVDRALDQAEEVRDEIAQVAEANREQASTISDVGDSVDRLTDTRSGDDRTPP